MPIGGHQYQSAVTGIRLGLDVHGGVWVDVQRIRGCTGTPIIVGGGDPIGATGIDGYLLGCCVVRPTISGESGRSCQIGYCPVTNGVWAGDRDRCGDIGRKDMGRRGRTTARVPNGDGIVALGGNGNVGGIRPTGPIVGHKSRRGA